MSNSGSNDSINLDLIDLNISNSDPSSGEFYEPSRGVLRRARDTIERTDKLLGSTRYFLRNRAPNLNPEHQHINLSEHPQNQEHQQSTNLKEHQKEKENEQSIQNIDNIQILQNIEKKKKVPNIQNINNP